MYKLWDIKHQRRRTIFGAINFFAWHKKFLASNRGGTSQDFSHSNHSSRAGALTCDSRVRAKTGTGDRGLNLLLSVTKAWNINILALLQFAPWKKVEEKVEFIFEAKKFTDTTRLPFESSRVIFRVDSWLVPPLASNDCTGRGWKICPTMSLLAWRSRMAFPYSKVLWPEPNPLPWTERTN